MLAGGGCVVGNANSGEAAATGGDIFTESFPPAENLPIGGNALHNNLPGAQSLRHPKFHE